MTTLAVISAMCARMSCGPGLANGSG